MCLKKVFIHFHLIQVEPKPKNQNAVFSSNSTPDGTNTLIYGYNFELRYFLISKILHMWTSHGFANAYPAAFGIQTSKLTAAMDVAR